MYFLKRKCSKLAQRLSVGVIQSHITNRYTIMKCHLVMLSGKEGEELTVKLIKVWLV